MTKALTPTEISKKQNNSDSTKTPLKISITQRLQTALGRSIAVTTATKTGVVKPVNGILTFPVTVETVLSKGYTVRKIKS